MSKFLELINEASSKSNSVEIMTEWGDILDYYVSKLEELDEECYNQMIAELYVTIHGEHMSKEMSMKAVSKLENVDGTMGAHWTLEQTTNVAERAGIRFEKFNEYDWFYVLNMIYSDYSKVLGSDDSYYIKMALAFLEDKDAPEGKAYRYYKNVVE